MDTSQSRPGWVLSYFCPEQETESDSLHLAWSGDGRHWHSLNGGRPVYAVNGIGCGHIRDPFLFRKQDGTFVYLATDWTRTSVDTYWSSPSPCIFIADSIDLIHYTNPRLVPMNSLPGHLESTMHAWAPEAFWDTARQQYGVLWSGDDVRNINRIYVNYTDDFVSFSEPEVFFYPGYGRYGVIDGSLFTARGRHYLAFKDTTTEHVQLAASDSLGAGSFEVITPEGEAVSRIGGNDRLAEGPFVIEDGVTGYWYLYADYYAHGGVFGGWRSRTPWDHRSWEAMAAGLDYSFPPGVRHANAIRVAERELAGLRAVFK